MTITIKTTYENVNEEWLADWIESVGNLPELHSVRDELKECGHAVYVSKDPTSNCVGTTEYRITS